MRHRWAEAKTPAQAVRSVLADKWSRIIGASVLVALVLLILCASGGGGDGSRSHGGGPQHRVYGPTADRASNGSSVHSDIAGITVYSTSD
jgi:hypothetical protein